MTPVHWSPVVGPTLVLCQFSNTKLPLSWFPLLLRALRCPASLEAHITLRRAHSSQRHRGRTASGVTYKAGEAWGRWALRGAAVRLRMTRTGTSPLGDAQCIMKGHACFPCSRPRCRGKSDRHPRVSGPMRCTARQRSECHHKGHRTENRKVKLQPSHLGKSPPHTKQRPQRAEVCEEEVS